MSCSQFYVWVVSQVHHEQLRPALDELFLVCNPRSMGPNVQTTTRWSDFSCKRHFCAMKDQELSLEELMPSELHLPEQAIVVYVHDGNIVCYVHMLMYKEESAIKGSEHHGPTVEYEMVSTQEDVRQKGWAQHVLRYVETAAKAHGYHRLFMRIGEKKHFRDFLARNGYGHLAYAQERAGDNHWGKRLRS